MGANFKTRYDHDYLPYGPFHRVSFEKKRKYSSRAYHICCALFLVKILILESHFTACIEDEMWFFIVTKFGKCRPPLTKYILESDIQ